MGENMKIKIQELGLQCLEWTNPTSVGLFITRKRKLWITN